MIGKLQTSGGLGFIGGQRRKLNPFVPGTGLYRVSGFHFDEAGSLVKWGGMAKYNTTQLLESAVAASFTGLLDFTKSDQTKQALAMTPAGIYRLNSGVWDVLQSGLTATVNDLADLAVYKNLVYACNGVDGNRKYDGTTVMNMGVAAPSSACTAALGAAGVLTGDYSYKVTFYNAALAHESNPSPVSNTIAATSDQISLSGIPISADTQVTRRRLYRTSTGGAVWRFLAEIADNTTTTYVDNLADSTLGVAIEAQAFGVPPVAAMLLVWRGFLFMVPKNSSRVWFSKQGFPNAVHPNDFRDLDADDGDIVTGLTNLNGPVAFKNDSIWNATGQDRNTLDFTQQVRGVGSVNHKGIVKIPGKDVVMFPSEEGFYGYNGLNEEYLSTEIESEWRGLNRARLKYISGTIYKPKNLAIWLCSTGSSGQHDLAITYDYVQEQWSTRPLTNTKSNIAAIIEDANNNESVYFGGYGGHVWQGDTGLSDDGSVIACEVISRAHPDRDTAQDSVKSFQELLVWFAPQAGVTATASYAVDDPNGTYTTIGTVDCSKASGQDRLRFAGYGRRCYIKVVNSASGQPLTLRGMKVLYQSLDRVYA